MTKIEPVLTWRAVLLCAGVLTPLAAARAQERAMTNAQACPSSSRDIPTLSPDSIGYLRLDQPLAALRHLCATARDTIVQSQGDAGPSYHGLGFYFESLTVVALQYGTSTVDLSRPADGWLVSGTRATIQRKVSLTSSWPSLYEALGTVQANAGQVLVVRFCSFPNAILTLDVDPSTVVTRSGRVDLATIPSTATIRHVFIVSRSLASHLEGC